MKVSRMKLTPPELRNIRAFFTVTIGSIRMRNWKLIKSIKDDTYKVLAPSDSYVNSHGNIDYDLLVEILDKKIIDQILLHALKEYEIQKSIQRNNNELANAN